MAADHDEDAAGAGSRTFVATTLGGLLFIAACFFIFF